MLRRKRSRILLDFNLVEKRKFYEKQDENDQGSDRGKMCFVFCGASCNFLASPATLNLLAALYDFIVPFNNPFLSLRISQNRTF